MTDTTQNRKFRYRITKVPKYEHGFDQEQLNVLALAVLNEVNAAQVDLEYEKNGAGWTSRRSDICIDPNYQISATAFIDLSQCWDFHIPKCKCVITLVPTTEAVRTLFKKLGIKVEKETL